MIGKQYNDKEIIEGIIQGNPYILIFIYKKFKKDIIRYIINNGGCRFDADEAFQDSLMYIKYKLDRNKDVIEHNFKNYLFTICVRVWKKDKEIKIKENEKLNDYVLYSSFNDTDKFILLMMKCYRQLQDGCQKVFLLQSEGLKYCEIAEEMKLSENYVKTKRKRCFMDFMDLYNNLLKDES